MRLIWKSFLEGPGFQDCHWEHVLDMFSNAHLDVYSSHTALIRVNQHLLWGKEHWFEQLHTFVVWNIWANIYNACFSLYFGPTEIDTVCTWAAHTHRGTHAQFVLLTHPHSHINWAYMYTCICTHVYTCEHLSHTFHIWLKPICDSPIVIAMY